MDKLKKVLDVKDSEQYKKLCCPNPHDWTRGVKLTKPRFKQFLSQRYGTYVAEKWQNMFDYVNNAVDEDSFKKQLIQILKDPKRDVLYQLGFDFYDAANDEKISEFDLFKVI